MPNKTEWPFDVVAAPRGAFEDTRDLVFRISTFATPDELMAEEGSLARQVVFEQCHVLLPITYSVDSVEPTHPEYPAPDEEEPIAYHMAISAPVTLFAEFKSKRPIVELEKNARELVDNDPDIGAQLRQMFEETRLRDLDWEHAKYSIEVAPEEER